MRQYGLRSERHERINPRDGATLDRKAGIG
jgi:hypothetical protein